MAVFDFLKKKDQNKGNDMGGFDNFPAPPEEMHNPTDIPTDQVVNFKKQGLSDNQIVQMLQRSGYEPAHIYDAMNQADAAGNQDISRAQQQFAPSAEEQHQYNAPNTQQDSSERFEEIAESLIDEKWQQFSQELQRLSSWKEDISTRLAKAEQGFADLKSEIENMHTAVVGKLSDYDKNLLNVGTEIKAMEKVFQKVLPTFTDNINELTKVTKELKKK